ncbi:MAG: hypothetical protein JWO52_5899 [Gammaproteobacteria bacterium]|nr:hypothetical protein [Gammaproteobacteria bacterium]
MATSRRQPPPRPERPKHTIPEKLHDIKMIEQRISELEAFDPNSITARFSDSKVKVVETAIEETLADVFGNETDDYNRYVRATSLDHGPVSMVADGWGRHNDLAEARQYITEGKEEALALLRQAARRLREEIEREQALAGANAAPVPRPSAGEYADSRRVFIVHGAYSTRP